MDLLILLSYAALAVGAFKVFKIPVNGYTVVTAALGGIALLAALLLTMNYNHPFTRVGRFYFRTTPIVPQVQGKVIEVLVSDKHQVKAGDILFKIDPTPFQAIVDQNQAMLVAAKQRAEGLKVNLEAYQEAFNSAVANRNAAQDTYERDQKLVEQNATSRAEFEQSKQAYLSAVARASQANAELKRAQLEAESLVEGVHTDVAEAEARLAKAQFDLDETVVRAPTDGVVLQVMLRPGMMAVPLPLKPVMIFQHDENPVFVASFLQNNAQRVTQGAEAEAIFQSVPGRFFKGKVKLVGAVVAQGQLQPSGELVAAEKISGEGRINVSIEFEEEAFEGFTIAPGSTGQVAVYSEHMEPLAIIRRILLRMKSWTNFIFSDGH
ncbi:efflux RND transporter periplasmic adaptor subunit [Stieleria sp. JC731]|uniref:HlyD family secretion protein n=1 Tax=Pirellulaceae TaxID=2691357 RepID=UPI001E2943DD|nr:efflux RND transporter periplasmic adaptor subunit [Stieleria sp. JC731]MCC9599090.1 efflux RND transporter periplasmic adaptor subunit [Stieleria sp. JC731]